MTIVGADDEKFRQLIDPQREWELVATGFRFTEGPVWSSREGCLYFSDIPNESILRWDGDGSPHVVHRPSYHGNGLALDASGDMIVCEQFTGCLVRRRDGERTILASHFRGCELNSPNDVVIGPDRSIYFTDPPYGRQSRFGRPDPPELPFQGVYRLKPDAAEVELAVAEDEFDRPNGLCFSPDETVLYVNDTSRALIKAYDVTPDGELTNGRVFVDGIGDGNLRAGAPDGMKTDELGNIWVTGPGGVWVFDPQGKRIGTLAVPELVGNLAWGGEDRRTLFVAASTSVYRTWTEVRGNPPADRPAT